MIAAWRAGKRAVTVTNLWFGYTAGILVAVSALVLTWEVLARYFFDRPTDWALELCIFMLIASTFLAAGHTLAAGAHVNIDIVDHLMSGRRNRWRLLLADLGAAGFCAFVAANAWRLTAVAYREGWVANSIWSPKLWVPFVLIAAGMTLLTLQYMVQIVDKRVASLRQGDNDGRT